MYIVVIAWLYVALMMSVAEATNTTGTVLGAVITFVLYGLLPVALVIYLMGTPGRKRALRAREAAERQMHAGSQAAASVTASVAPDQGGEAPADAIPSVREEQR
jgi:mannose/fructose/N-acetylgalactosamine-specific phosphotransferase system component IID